MAGKRPAFQFYPGDWMKDPNLRRCSLAARGMWIDMLCLMFECDERGVLASGGEPWTREEIACAVGGAQDAALSCLDELVRKGVARQRADGAIYSARLVRDEEIRRARERAGRIGGSKLKAKGKAKGKAKCEQDAEGEDEEEVSPKGESAEGGKYPAEFERWWAVYPRKAAKGDAAKAWKKLGSARPPTDTLIAAVQAQAKSKQWRDGYIPNPATWLRGHRWDDEVEPVGKSGTPQSPLDSMSAQELNALYQRTLEKHPELKGHPKGTDDVRKAMYRVWKSEQG